MNNNPLLSKHLSTITKAIIPLAASALLTACLGGGGGGASSDTTTPSVQTGSASPSGGSVSQPGDATPGAGGGSDGGGASKAADFTDTGAAGKSWYVATNGNDNTNSGSSLDQPFRTIEKAIDAAQPGDTILVRGGNYTPQRDTRGIFFRKGGKMIDTNGDGKVDKKIFMKLKNYNNEKVVISAVGQFVLYFMYGPYWIIEGLELKGGTEYTVKIDNNDVRLVGNNIHGSSNDIVKLVSTSNDVVIYGNEIHHTNAPTGANAQAVDIVGADRVLVANNYVHDIASIGIYAKGNSRNVVFENNRLERIAQRALMLGQLTGAQFLEDGRYETYDSIIRNNIVVDSDVCLATASSWNAKIYNNSCYNVGKNSHGAIFVSNESEIGQAGNRVTIRNNIVHGTGNRPMVKIGPNAMVDNSTLVIDNNVYWTPTGESKVTFLWEDRGLYNVPVATWTGIGLDRGSKIGDPKYTNNTLLTIGDGSVAIDAGVATSDVTADYNGAARPKGAGVDIGAYEYR